MRITGIAGFILCAWAVLQLAAGHVHAQDGESIFEFKVVETERISGWISTRAGGTVTVDWGDGTRDLISGSRQGYDKNYGESVNVKVNIYAEDESVLAGFRMNRGGANISFDLKDVPARLTRLDVRGQSAVRGDIKDLPEGLITFDCFGNYNTVHGDVKDLPRGMTGHFRVWGRNTIGGDVKGLPEGVRLLEVGGDNSMSGDIAGLPEGLRTALIAGSNTVSGDIKNLPRELVRLSLGGDNTLSGNIADLPEGIRRLAVSGRNTISEYTAGREWAENIAGIDLRPSADAGLSTEEVDNLLIDLARTTWVNTEREPRLWLIGGNMPRSSASDDAVAVLEDMGVNVRN